MAKIVTKNGDVLTIPIAYRINQAKIQYDNIKSERNNCVMSINCGDKNGYK
jgi:hypothetical protein